MKDKFGHHISYLRISITDRCNERCHYCMPQEEQIWLPRADVLSYEEILRVARVGSELGIQKVRVTGGEPLTRKNLLFFIEKLCRIPGINDVGISTNGTLLTRPAYPDSAKSVALALKSNGVRTVNISLDTLDRKTYEEATGRDYLERAIAGIEAAVAAGFEQVKLNAVLMRHRNEHELWDLVEFAREKNCLLRFIELMAGQFLRRFSTRTIFFRPSRQKISSNLNSGISSRFPISKPMARPAILNWKEVDKRSASSER